MIIQTENKCKWRDLNPIFDTMLSNQFFQKLKLLENEPNNAYQAIQ